MRSTIMSSITMAADSTQADIIHCRVKAAVPRRVKATGARLRQEDVYRSRHHKSSGTLNQSKSFCRFQNRSKNLSRRNRSRTRDDCSDHDSDLDLSKDLLPISGYVRLKEEMVDHMFRSISNRKLHAMLPEILKQLSTDDLKKLCVEQLEVMSKKRICCILEGADPDAISSSGTEEDSYEEENSRNSTDLENEGEEVVSASIESEAVGCTSLCKADEVTSRHSQESSFSCLTADKDGCGVSCEKTEPALEGTEGFKDQNEYRMGKDEETCGITDETVLFQKSSLGVEDNVHGMMHEGEYHEDCMSGEIARDETMKQGRRNVERSYRTKQLDDDDHEANSALRGTSEGRKNRSDQHDQRDEMMGMELSGASQMKNHVMLANNDISDIGSIPDSLPSLDSEPEETCFPFLSLNQGSGLACGANTILENSSTVMKDLFSEVGAGNSCELLIDSTAVAANLIEPSKGCKVTTTKSPIKNDANGNDNLLKKSPKSAELVSEGEEMIIEVQDHEFSDGDEENNDKVHCGIKVSYNKQLPQTMLNQNAGNKMKTSLCKEVVPEAPFETQSTDLSINHPMQKQRLLEEEITKADKTDINDIRSVDECNKVTEPRRFKRKVTEPSENNEVSQKFSKLFYYKNSADNVEEHTVSKSESSDVNLLSNKAAIMNKSYLSDPPADICFEEHITPLQTSLNHSKDMTTEHKFTVQIGKNHGTAENSQSVENERSVMQKAILENCQIEANHKKVVVNKTKTKASHSSSDPDLQTEDNETVQESVPVLSKTQLEILELEMRARAIKAMLKAQEELERREEKLKSEEKHSSELHRVVTDEKKEPRSGSSSRGSTLTVQSRSSQAEEVARARLVQKHTHQALGSQQQNDFQLVKRLSHSPINEVSNNVVVTKLTRQSSDHLPVKSCRNVMVSGISASGDLVKRPVVLATRGRGTNRNDLTNSVTRRIVQLSSGQKSADKRTVVRGPNTLTSRIVTSTSDRSSRTVAYTKKDTRRVVATGRSSQVPRIPDSAMRYGNRDREHRSSVKDQGRSVIPWQRRKIMKQGFRGSRF